MPCCKDKKQSEDRWDSDLIWTDAIKWRHDNKPDTDEKKKKQMKTWEKRAEMRIKSFCLGELALFIYY